MVAEWHVAMGTIRSLITALITVAVVVSCSSAPPAASTGVTSAPFGPADITAAIEKLAAAGVAVRIAPSDSPLAAPVGQSRVALLRFQVRNLALEARGGGTPGSELDEFAAENGGSPVSYLIAAWAQSAGTPAAAAASELLGDTASVDPPALHIPGLVTTLFLADLLQGPAAEPARPVPAATSGTSAAETGFCDEVGAYLSGVLDGMLDPTQALAPAWLAGAIDRYAVLETDPVRLRNAVASTAILVYATSISRPWLVHMTYSPLGEAHYIVGEDELTVAPKEVRVTVDPGDGSFAEEVKGCAELADAQLTETEIDDSPVVWVAPGIESHATEGEEDDVDDELDEHGTAAYAYQTKGETDETHKKGTLQSETVVAIAIIQRQDIGALKTLVEQLITGSGVLAPNVQAVYDRLKPELEALLYPRGWQTVDISWHGAPSPTPAPRPSTPPTTDPSGSGGGTQPCDAGCAGSNGDPHLRTVDGLSYDFQAAGEFTLLRSLDGAIQIQARQEPYADSTSVSINTALAVRANGRRVALYALPDESLELRVDGATTTEAFVDLGGGATVSVYPEGVEVRLEDGTTVWGLSVGKYGIHAMIAPSATLRETGAGIVGPVPPGTSLPSLPDGTARPADSEYHAFLYGPFADAWQLTDATSLFDYQPGTSTATFAKPGFPAPGDIVTLELLDPEARANGEAACAAIVDPGLRDECIFDVAITGDPGFVDGYDLTDMFLRGGAEALGPPGSAGGPQATSTPLPVGPLPDGIVEILPSIAALLGSTLGPDGMLYLSVRMLDGTHEVVAVEPEAGRITARVDAQGGGQVAVTAGSVWVGEFTGGSACSVTRLDAATLEVQATIATSCTWYYTELAATANALWYQDTPGFRAGDPGAKLSWIDPATNQVAGFVELPYTLGLERATDLRATDGSVFFGFDADPGYTVLRLRVGEDRFVPLPTQDRLTLPVGDGIWTQNDDIASFFSTGDAADQSVPIDGALVAADDASLYVQRFGAQDHLPELWRHPLDGTTPVLLARGATIGTAWGDQTLDYFGEMPLFTGATALVQLRLVYASEDISESRVLVQWIPR